MTTSDFPKWSPARDRRYHPCTTPLIHLGRSKAFHAMTTSQQCSHLLPRKGPGPEADRYGHNLRALPHQAI
jgi:hypothetical protein